ncbi:MAG: inositol monophosphatase family protein [Candidatus Omnitrophota bacterium]
MKIDLKRPEIRFAVELIQKGSELARCVRAETSVRSMIKPDRSPVTFADMGIQALAGAFLEQYLPGAVLVAEEDTDLFATSEGEKDLEKITGYVRSFFPGEKADKVREWIGRGQGKPAASFWTLDPIDGTKGFLRGGQYAIALAFIRDGKVELAAMGCPELELEDHKALGKGVGILSARGQGCWAASLNGLQESRKWTRLEVSQCREVRQSRILDSFDPEHKNAEKNRRIREVLGTLTEPILMDSMAKHAVIASGDAEIFLRTLSPKDTDHREKIWDVAAGALVIEEAGGRVTDLEGRELDFGAGLTLARNPGLVATNGFLHEPVLDALRNLTRP